MPSAAKGQKPSSANLNRLIQFTAGKVPQECKRTGIIAFLTADERPPTLLNVVFPPESDEPAGEFESKDALLNAIQGVLNLAQLTEVQQERITSRVRDTNSTSLVDVFRQYFDSLNIDVESADIRKWTKLRGSVVHSAAVSADAIQDMRQFVSTVRSALTEELHRSIEENDDGDD